MAAGRRAVAQLGSERSKLRKPKLCAPAAQLSGNMVLLPIALEVALEPDFKRSLKV